VDPMARTSESLLAVVGDEPASTSELYDRVGYPALVRLGLIPYAAFREALTRLAASGAIERQTGPDGSTMWRRSSPSEAGGGHILG
jgi:hypothetical protein